MEVFGGKSTSASGPEDAPNNSQDIRKHRSLWKYCFLPMLADKSGSQDGGIFLSHTRPFSPKERCSSSSRAESESLSCRCPLQRHSWWSTMPCGYSILVIRRCQQCEHFVSRDHAIQVLEGVERGREVGGQFPMSKAIEAPCRLHERCKNVKVETVAPVSPGSLSQACTQLEDMFSSRVQVHHKWATGQICGS